MSGNVELRTFFDDLVRVETRLYNVLNDRLRAAHGITASQFEFLLRVGAADGTRIADLARTFAVGVGATSKGVDRLEASGLLQRVPNPRNRRSSLLLLTAEGQALVPAAQATVDDVLTQLLGGADVRQAAVVLRTLRVALEDAGLGVPAG